MLIRKNGLGRNGYERGFGVKVENFVVLTKIPKHGIDS